MKFLITGSTGMLGQELRAALAGRDVTALSRSDLDITDLAAVRQAIAGHDVVINAAAYTQVDDAETNEAAAFAVNATGPENLAIATAETVARLVHISTDYVFDGLATGPYDESTPRNPISAYGRTKAEGERRVLEKNPSGAFVVRTAWLYGAGGMNFARTMLRLAQSHEILTVVNDQVGQPTWAGDLARQIVELVDVDAKPGIYHGTNSGAASWFDFTREIFQVVGLDPHRVTPTTSAQFVRAAPRPDNSVLGHDAWARAGLAPMRNWRAAVSAANSAGAFALPTES